MYPYDTEAGKVTGMQDITSGRVHDNVPLEPAWPGALPSVGGRPATDISQMDIKLHL